MTQDIAVTTGSTTLALLLTYALPALGAVAVCLNICWLYYKIKRERLEITKLTKEDNEKPL